MSRITMIPTIDNKPSLNEVSESFREHFNVPFQPFLNPLYSALTGKVQIDIFKFDDYLHSRFGMYEKQGKSMKDIIVEKFGQQAMNYLDSLLFQ